MLNPDHNATPFNAVPPLVLALAGAMALIELALTAGGEGLIGGPGAVGWRVLALERFAFSGPLLEWMLSEPGRVSAGGLLRLVSYPFVHAGFTHMLFAAVITLALGKFVGEVFTQGAMLAVWVVTSVAAAVAFAVLTDSARPLFGGMAPAYGLVGAYTFVLWWRGRALGQPWWMAFRMIGFLVALQLLFSGIAGGIGPEIVAELAAFAAGFGMSFVVRPGGLAAVTRDLRRR
jgi:rhomboid protease GluP